MHRRISLSLVFLSFVITSFAQDVKVNGGFVTDSLKIGEQIPFTLSASYSKDQMVVFPDSSFSFAPFEFQKKKFFPTKTSNGQSYDSVVYWLATYEIDSVQTLQLPVFIVHPKDCTTSFSKIDTVFLKQLVRHVPDSVEAKKLPLKSNTNYLNVKRLFNYPIALLIAGILGVLLIIGFFVFGGQIRRYFLLRRLNRNHQSFLAKFNDIVSSIPSNLSAAKAEAAVVLWKYYMENLVQTPYSKLTSKEIEDYEKNDLLGNALHAIDRVIYGGIDSPPIESFEQLRQYCEKQFQLKLEQTKNG